MKYVTDMLQPPTVLRSHREERSNGREEDGRVMHFISHDTQECVPIVTTHLKFRQWAPSHCSLTAFDMRISKQHNHGYPWNAYPHASQN